MALNLVPPSAPVYNTYEQSVEDFLERSNPANQIYHLPVGALGLAELAAGATLADVVATGCRFFAAWPDGTVTSCEMTDPNQYGKAEFRNFTTGAPVMDAFNRIAEAQALNAMANDYYELHFLSIPGIYLEALHLVCKGKNYDYVLPLVSVDPQLDVNAVCDAPTFLGIASATAAARVKMTSADPLSS